MIALISNYNIKLVIVMTSIIHTREENKLQNKCYEYHLTIVVIVGSVLVYQITIQNFMSIDLKKKIIVDVLILH